MRGHILGCTYYEGSALPNTAVPGLVGGFAGETCCAPRRWRVSRRCAIGAHVEEGQVVAYAGDAPVVATLTGVFRGLIADEVRVRQGLKCGDGTRATKRLLRAGFGQRPVGCGWCVGGYSLFKWTFSAQ